MLGRRPRPGHDPGTTAITGSLPVEDQGVASALNDTVRELGGAIGIALIGSVLSATYSSSVADATAGLPPDAAHAVEEGIGGRHRRLGPRSGPQGHGLLDAARSAFVDGWTVSMWLSAGLALAIAAFAFAWMPGGRPRARTSSSRRTATSTTSSTSSSPASSSTDEG